MRSHLFAVLTGALVACDSGVQSTSFGGVTQQVELSASEGSEAATNEGISTSTVPESDTTSSTTEDGPPGMSTGDGTKWDMAVPDFAPEVGGCQGKIDFLFVVSSEGTMKGSQEKLL